MGFRGFWIEGDDALETGRRFGKLALGRQSRTQYAMQHERTGVAFEQLLGGSFGCRHLAGIV